MKKVEFCLTCQKTECGCYKREILTMFKLVLYAIVIFWSLVFIKSIIYTFS